MPIWFKKLTGTKQGIFETQLCNVLDENNSNYNKSCLKYFSENKPSLINLLLRNQLKQIISIQFPFLIKISKVKTCLVSASMPAMKMKDGQMVRQLDGAADVSRGEEKEARVPTAKQETQQRAGSGT